MAHMIARAAAACLLALVTWYLSGLAYRLIMHVGFYLVTMTMIVLHMFSIDSSVLSALSMGFERARDSTPAMYFAAMALAGVALVLGFRMLDFRVRRRESRLALIGSVAVLLAGLTVDFTYGITLLSDISFRERTFNTDGRAVVSVLTVEEIMALRHDLSSAFVQSTGTVDYQPELKRFILRSLEEPGRYIKLIFHRGRKTLFSEIRSGGKPRYFERVEPFIGKTVTVVGISTTGQMDLLIDDIQVVP